MNAKNTPEGATGDKDQSLWQQHEPLAVVVINLRIALRDAVEFRESIDPRRLEIILTEVDRALATERNTSYQNGYRDGTAYLASLPTGENTELLDAIIYYYAAMGWPRYTDAEPPHGPFTSEMMAAQSASMKRHRERHMTGAAPSPSEGKT